MGELLLRGTSLSRLLALGALNKPREFSLSRVAEKALQKGPGIETKLIALGDTCPLIS